MEEDNNFDEDIQKYIDRILHSSNRLQAIHLRTNALKFIDQWRLQRLEQLDQHVRMSGKLILNAFDEYQSRFIRENFFQDNRVDCFRSTTTGEMSTSS